MNQQISLSEDIAKLGTIMSVWAHPDDETYACAGIMATAVRQGQKVICITATKGELGVQDPDRWSPEQLATIREQELKAALELLGVTNHVWLGYRDGECTNVVVAEAAAKIADLISYFRPDSILTFGPDGLTGHDDHRQISVWVKEAVALSKLNGQKPNIYHVVQTLEAYSQLSDSDEKSSIFFNIDRPPLCKPEDCAICFCLDSELMELKYQALKAMPSQTERLLSRIEDKAFLAFIEHEAFLLAR